MHPSRSHRTDLCRVVLACFAALLLSLPGCGGGSGGSSDDGGSKLEDPADTAWQKVAIQQIAAGGLLLPNVRAMADGSGQLHIAYFADSETVSGGYTVNHILWDLQMQEMVSEEPVVDIDNCRTLDLSLLGDGSPVVAYQGGTVRAGGSEQQSDVMVSILEGDAWSEYTGGIGFVERNPVFSDGLAGKHVSMAVDDAGDIHLCYQFFYEGIDAMNFNYPDLLYVEKDGSSPGTESAEETVEGNVYNTNGTASEQNRVGERLAMVMDSDGSPVVFYYADLVPNSSDPDTKGLRAARRQNGVWQCEWVETGIEPTGTGGSGVGDISCGLDALGNLCVAYYVEGEYAEPSGITHSQCLKYATDASGSWETTLVDETTWCGKHCSLALDAAGNPAIAYYSLRNNSGSLTLQDLRLASLTGATWKREVVASTGDIGNYNTLWFDADGTTYICTYSKTDHTIYLFHR